MCIDTNWEHLGEDGPHRDHHLHSDDMLDVWCVECQRFLDESEAFIAWPM